MVAKFKLELLGIVSGAVAGFSYWYFVGCSSGSCAITSSPYVSTIYGSFLGALSFSLLRKESPNTKNSNK